MGWGSSTRRGGGQKVRALPRNFVLPWVGMSREFCRDVPGPLGVFKKFVLKKFVRIFCSLTTQNLHIFLLFTARLCRGSHAKILQSIAIQLGGVLRYKWEAFSRNTDSVGLTSQYKLEVHCNTNWRCIAIQTGGALPCKLDVLCNANWRCNAIQIVLRGPNWGLFCTSVSPADGH